MAMRKSYVVNVANARRFVKMFTKPEPKARLERADPRESILQNDIIIRISLTTALILAMILFLAICFIVKGPTYGYL